MINMMFILVIYAVVVLLIFILIDLYFKGRMKRNMLILGISIFMLGFFNIMDYGKKVIIIENAKQCDISLKTLNKSLVDNGFKPLNKLPY